MRFQTIRQSQFIFFPALLSECYISQNFFHISLTLHTKLLTTDKKKTILRQISSSSIFMYIKIDTVEIYSVERSFFFWKRVKCIILFFLVNYNECYHCLHECVFFIRYFEWNSSYNFFGKSMYFIHWKLIIFHVWFRVSWTEFVINLLFKRVTFNPVWGLLFCKQGFCEVNGALVNWFDSGCIDVEIEA